VRRKKEPVEPDQAVTMSRGRERSKGAGVVEVEM
jgi:hypothetical protein